MYNFHKFALSWMSRASYKRKNEKVSILIALLQEEKNDVPELAAWLKRDEKYKWLSHNASNEK